MNKSTLLSKLNFIVTEQVGLEMYFLHQSPKADEGIEILRVNLEGTAVQTRLEKVFKDKIKKQFFGQNDEGKSIDDAPEWFLKHIKDVDELKNTYYFFPNEESKDEEYHIPVEFLEMERLQNLIFEKVPSFEFDKHSLDNVFASLIRMQIDGKQAIFYKHKYPIDVLSRSTVLRVLGMTLQHKTQFSLEQAPLLKVSDKIDFMFFDNNFIILNLSLLESKYGFNERYFKKGTESLEIIKNKKILVDSKVFDELVKKVSFSKKLMKVKSDNLVLKTPFSEIKSFLDDYTTTDGKFSLAKRIKFIPAQGKFEVKSKKAAEDFMRLLNDQYLISLLTKKPYVSDVQSEFENKEEKEETKTAPKKVAKDASTK
jgi:hypothetical protein